MNRSASLWKPVKLATGTTLLCMCIWEGYLRYQQFTLSYIDDGTTWAAHRNRVEQGEEVKTVIIGSSRMKFDLDLDVYEKMTGMTPVQLSVQGTCPLPVLNDLADHSKFNGTLFVGVTERLFFTEPQGRAEAEIRKRIDSYHRFTPAQQASFGIGRALDSFLLFFEPDEFSLNMLLKRLEMPSRPGVREFPNFPIEFVYVEKNRQTKMTPFFIRDTATQEQMKGIWARLGLLSKKKGVGGDTLVNILQTVKVSVEKIKARGGRVIFVRCPSVGKLWETEALAYPRDQYWDELLRYTDSPGIHFSDYPALSRFDCPEWSHLKPSDAAAFTEDLVKILRERDLLPAEAARTRR